MKEKVGEEVEEFDANESVGELADIVEVVNAICKYKKINKKFFESIRKKKVAERGTFKKRIILEES